MPAQTRTLLIGAVVFVLLLSMSLFTVRETDLAIKFSFGKVINSEYEPGLHFKIPFLQNVRKFEKRIVSPRDYPAEQFLTSEGKILRIDFYIRWRINQQQVSRYYQATSGGEAEEIAAGRIGSIVKDGIKGVIARRTIQQVVAADRTEFTDEIIKIAKNNVAELGVTLVDVRVKKIDLPDEVSDSVFNRMRQDFDRQAKRLRAEGQENAERLQASADRERTELLAQAYKQAEIIRGEGDARSAEIYAQAYSRNAEFYSFFRSLQAYRESIGTEGDVLVISPQSDFFKYLKRSTR